METPKRPRGRPPRPKLPDERAETIAKAALTGDKGLIERTITNDMMAPTCSHQIVSPEHVEAAIAMVAGGSTLAAACKLLGIDSALVRWKCTQNHDLAQRLTDARRLGADHVFESMLPVAMDTTLPVADRRLIVEVMRDIAKVHNRGLYGDKVQHQHEAVVINLSADDMKLC